MLCTTSVRHCKMMRLKTLLVRERSVIPRQLLQSPRSPFLSSFIMTPFFHSFRMSLLYLEGCAAICGVFPFLLLSSFRDILHSLQGLCQFLKFCIAFYTSISYYLKVLTCSISGSGLFRIFLNCSLIFSSFAVSSVIVVPSCVFLQEGLGLDQYHLTVSL